MFFLLEKSVRNLFMEIFLKMLMFFLPGKSLHNDFKGKFMETIVVFSTRKVSA